MFRLVVVSCLLALALGASVSIKGKKPLRSLVPIFPSGRIVGGKPTTIDQVPWQVALEYSGFQFCGGSILSETAVLSAGHCIEDFVASEITVRYGSSNHETGGTLTQASELRGHDKYNGNTIDYDVSVILVKTAIKLGNNAQPIKPADNEPAADTQVTISGWGTLTENGDTPDQLQSVVVPIVDRSTCEDAYESLNPITARMICAGVAGKDSCQGDSGGPVAVDGTVVGIVSWGLGCARAGYPGVYTNVADSNIRSFIRDNANV